MAETSEAADKAQLRITALERRSKLGAAERAEAVAAATEHFLASVPLDAHHVVALYWPIRDEIDCKPLLIKLMNDGVPVCLPVVMGEDQPLQFRIWASGEALYEAGFGSLAPAEGAQIVEPDIVVIPLLGFDKNGTRLGYGKGYYDRSLAGMAKKPLLVGYAFAAQQLDHIPAYAHDVPLDIMITEQGVTRFK